MIDRLPGTRNAAPNPWTARASTNWRMFGARPQPTEATAKTITPTRNIRLRPNRSPSEPPTRINAPRSNPYASTTHWMSVTVPRRLDWSAGSATLTTVLSIKAMLEPRIVTARIHGPASDVQGTVAYPDSIAASSHGGFIIAFFRSEEKLAARAWQSNRLRIY